MRKLTYLVLATALFFAGCDDDLGPRDWDATPDTVTLFSLDRPEYQMRPGAFNFIDLRAVVVELPSANGQWDIALTGAADTLFLTPASAFDGINTQTGVAVVPDASFDEVEEAPTAAAFIGDRSVPVREDEVYVVRTRSTQILGQSCVRFAKLRAVEIDTDAGTLSFEYVRNPNCNNRDFIPPGDD